MKSEQAEVVFQPAGRRGRVPVGITVLEASRRLGVGIESLCGEQQACGKCKIRVESGRFEKLGIDSKSEHAGPWQPNEGRFISSEERASGLRLGCAATVQGDLLIHVPEASRAGKQVVSKAARPIPIDLDPAVKNYLLSVPEASLRDPTADFERLGRILEFEHGLTGLTIDLAALRELPPAIRDGGGGLAVSVWMDREIIAVRSQGRSTVWGLAIDIGTTTLAAYLCDLQTAAVVATASMMNPQVTFGEDVISRICYHQSHPDGLQRMSAVLIEGLNRLIDRALADARVDLGCEIDRRDIEDVTICGNTVMHHILLQVDPEPLGAFPFAPANHHSLNIKARDLGLGVNPGAYVFLLPNPAGFVGGDNVGVILAEEPHKNEPLQLIIDIGTNGELALGNRDKLVCSSCATGPALEGAQIRFGMRAAPGAIERVRIDPNSGEVDYKVIGRDSWRSFSQPQEMQVRGICGSGILDVVAELFKAGVVQKSGAFSAGDRSKRLRDNPETGVREFVLARADETCLGQDVVITQLDIRQIQLAKAAIYAGCKLLLRRLGAQSPDVVKIAGAFGTHIDPALALVVGLFPDCPVECIEGVGNAAGDGCRMVLHDRTKREDADWIARNVEYVDLTLEPDFQQQLLDAMEIPHAEDRFPGLADILPPEILEP